ncbi:MAG: hypothetical protein JNM10_02560 [Planctomycetia bacterium]|nr:hypothetical protein [Planctomycetia bacterium]
MPSPVRYARLRTWAGCLGLLLVILGFAVVVTAVYAIVILAEVRRESP